MKASLLNISPLPAARSPLAAEGARGAEGDLWGGSSTEAPDSFRDTLGGLPRSSVRSDHPPSGQPSVLDDRGERRRDTGEGQNGTELAVSGTPQEKQTGDTIRIPQEPGSQTRLAALDLADEKRDNGGIGYVLTADDDEEDVAESQPRVVGREEETSPQVESVVTESIPETTVGTRQEESTAIPGAAETPERRERHRGIAEPQLAPNAPQAEQTERLIPEGDTEEAEEPTDVVTPKARIAMTTEAGASPPPAVAPREGDFAGVAPRGVTEPLPPGSIREGETALRMSPEVARGEIPPGPPADLVAARLGVGQGGRASSFGVPPELPLPDANSQRLAGAVESVARSLEPLAPTLRTFVPQPAVAVPVGSQDWGGALGNRILWLANQQLSVAQLRLDPPDLGPLQVRVAVQNEQISVTFTSNQAAVREALDQNAQRLREIFADQGLDLVNVDISDQSLAREFQRDGEHGARGRGAAADPEEEGAVAGAVTTTGLIDQYA